MVKTTLEIAHALRKTAAWERDPDRDWQRCVFHSARVARFGEHCSPHSRAAVVFCATGRVRRELADDDAYDALMRVCGDELSAIETMHDNRCFVDAADLLDGLALLVEETIPVAVTA